MASTGAKSRDRDRDRGGGKKAKPVNMHQAKTHLSKLVARVAKGEEIVIAKAGKPVARLVPIEPERPRKRVLGQDGAGVWIAPDFDAFVPPGWEEYMPGVEGEAPGAAP